MGSRGIEVNWFAYIRFILEVIFGADPLQNTCEWLLLNYNKSGNTKKLSKVVDDDNVT